MIYHSDKYSEFSAGNIIDFLVYYKSISYEKAVKYLLDVYFNQFMFNFPGGKKTSLL